MAPGADVIKNFVSKFTKLGCLEVIFKMVKIKLRKLLKERVNLFQKFEIDSTLEVN
jgi:hypothetical protein